MAAPESLESYVGGKWTRGSGVETELVNPVTGEALATVSAKGIDLGAALAYARTKGGPALRALSFAERAKLLDSVADVLIANRARYEAIAIANSGNTKIDAAIDIDGGIGTLKYYARLGGDAGRHAVTVVDDKPVRLAQGGELSGDPSACAAPRRRCPHQRVQLPELGPVGEGSGRAARRRARAREARLFDRAAVRTQWCATSSPRTFCRRARSACCAAARATCSIKSR